jgi:hypothetical protein
MTQRMASDTEQIRQQIHVPGPPGCPSDLRPTERAVPSDDHYHSDYLGQRAERLFSYQQQLMYTLQEQANSVLLVGKGDGLVEQILERYGVNVTTVDVEPSLEPDVVGSVDSIPCPDGDFDLSLCCQVLEHLPFERFGVALRELERVTRRCLVLSLPDVRRFVSLRARVASRSVDVQFSVPRLRPRAIPVERYTSLGHYWEIGFAGTGFTKVRTAIEASGWSIKQSRRVCDMKWHCFFQCHKRGR